MLSNSLKKISELDVFCLIVFKTLYEDGQANSTASELQVSAPKISRCLALLRSTFNDELFYRRQQGLKPTPLAELLYKPICDFYHTVARIEQVAFDESESGLTPILNVAVTEGIMSSLAIAISQHPLHETIGQIRLQWWDNNSAELIHNGELDFGIALDTSQTAELNCQLLGTHKNVCLAARVEHPIWGSLPHIRLNEIAKYSFLYFESKGFNDRIDPFEMYCRTARVELANVDKVTNRDEWFCHLMTMGSLAFIPAVEADFCKSMPGLRTEVLPSEQVKLLHGGLMSPQYYLIEKEFKNRRYSEERRSIIIDIVTDLLKSK